MMPHICSDMSNIRRHSAGSATAGKKAGGQFKQHERGTANPPPGEHTAPSQINTSRAIEVAENIRSTYSADSAQLEELKDIYLQAQKGDLTEDESAQFRDCADALEEANFHRESIAMQATAARSDLARGTPLSSSDSWVFLVDDYTRVTADAGRIREAEPGTAQSADTYLKHSSRTPFQF